MERGIACTWGSTFEERLMPFPCDRYMDSSNEAYFRAISMGIFKIIHFEQNRHLTIVMDDEQAISIFGEIAASYVVVPITQNTCRLILKGLICYPRNSFWS